MLMAIRAFGVDYVVEQLLSLPPCRSIDCDSIAGRQPLTELEGLWQLTGGGGTIAVVPVSESNPARGYVIVCVDMADRTILPGTTVGYASYAARQGSYDAAIYGEANDGKMTKPHRFTLTVRDGNRLSIVPVRNRLKVNLRNLLPYMFRVTVSRQTNRSDDLDGAIRIGPSFQKPLRPRIL